MKPHLAALLALACSGVAAAAEPPAAGLRCSGQAATPGQLQLQLGKSTLMRLPETIQGRSIGNPAVVQAMLVAPDTLYLAGVDIGSTNLIVQGKSGSCSVILPGVAAWPLQRKLAPSAPAAACVPAEAA